VSVPKARVSLDPKGKGQLSQLGPVLITHWGLSGPAVLKLSAWGARVLHDCHYRHPLWINWLPDVSINSLTEQLQALKKDHPRKQIHNFTTVSLPKRLWHYFMNQANIAETQVWADFSKKQEQILTQLLLNSQYTIQGKGVFKEEFVTCGGVTLKEINFKTMESRCCPGLYFAGEILDIDGVTGGFNFQNAWTTSYLAGLACADALTEG
jgi:predicted Rossmann fold flavoprotein